MKKKIITLDITPFCYRNQGIARMVKSLCEKMLHQNNIYEFRLYSRSLRNKPANNTKLENMVHFPLPRIFEPLMKKIGLVDWLVKSDLFHATDHYLPLKYPSKCVCTIHDLIFITQPQSNWEVHRYFNTVVPSFAKHCAHIITPSAFTKQMVIEHLGIEADNVTVIPWGIDRNQFYPNSDREQIRQLLAEKLSLKNPFYFALGTNTERKNLTFLLKSYLKLLPQRPEHDLILIGSPTTEQLRLWEESGSPKQVHFLQNVSDADLRGLYQTAAAFIYPSIAEGFGCPILEAFACHCPVISSNKSSLPEVGGRLPYYIDPFDEANMIKALELVENELNQMRPSADEFEGHLQKFTWDLCIQNTTRVYDKLIGG